MKTLDNVNRIIIHCSDSSFGDAKLIDKWHRARPKPFEMIGYHFVILNGCRRSAILPKEKRHPYNEKVDGLVESGRPCDKQGAHVYGRNSDSLAICLIGIHHFSDKQLLGALPRLLLALMKRYGIPINMIQGHGEFDKNKTCPNINMARVRDMLRMNMAANLIKGVL